MKYVHPIAAILAALCLQGCATRVLMVSTEQVPAAQGVVKAQNGSHNNLRLEIDVKHLAHPDRLAPGAMVFVVWARPLFAGAHPQNIGALRVNRNLDGELHTVTPLRSFDLLITPEPQGTVLAPSGPPVLKARIIRP